jgi:ribulose-5-phosphate 4-epimerase/fuculose-1-phosphate aldolase
MGHIYRHGMTTTSGGNLSAIDGLGNIWITPSGTDKGSLMPEDVVCVAPDGTVEGLHRPSMEYPLHREVYKTRPDIRALIHAHPPVLTSFSIVHRIPDTSVVRAWREICGSVGYAVYAIPGSNTMGELVASEFSKGHDAVIMENHAVVAGGRDLAEALARLEALECCAGAIHAAGFIGEIVIPDYSRENHSGQPQGSHTHPAGLDSASGRGGDAMSSEEELLAEEVCRMAVRACNRGLMHGYCGTVSARSGSNKYLITPKYILRCELTGRDVVKVSLSPGDVTGNITPAGGSTIAGDNTPAGGSTIAGDNTPAGGSTIAGDNTPAGGSTIAGDNTRAGGIIRTGGICSGGSSWLISEIYRRFPSVNAVIMAQPTYLMAFAVTGKEIDVRTIPESWLLLRKMPVVSSGALVPASEEIPAILAAGLPAVLISNDSVLVTGESLIQAFDRLEVAEMTARSLIIGQSLGSVKPIGSRDISELRKAFGIEE